MIDESPPNGATAHMGSSPPSNGSSRQRARWPEKYSLTADAPLLRSWGSLRTTHRQSPCIAQPYSESCVEVAATVSQRPICLPRKSAHRSCGFRVLVQGSKSSQTKAFVLPGPTESSGKKLACIPVNVAFPHVVSDHTILAHCLDSVPARTTLAKRKGRSIESTSIPGACIAAIPATLTGVATVHILPGGSALQGIPINDLNTIPPTITGSPTRSCSLITIMSIPLADHIFNRVRCRPMSALSLPHCPDRKPPTIRPPPPGTHNAPDPGTPPPHRIQGVYRLCPRSAKSHSSRSVS